MILPLLICLTEMLSAPHLKVSEPSFARMSSASVSWEAVENATGYAVTLDGKPVEVIGNTLYLAGNVGTHTVQVIAQAPHQADSPAAEAVIRVRSYGDGSAKNPYLIYDSEDWRSFASAQTGNWFSNNGFRGEYVALAANIDFCGNTIVPVGKNYSTAFQGIFDGRGYTLKNAVVEGGSGIGLFVSLRGIVTNLKADHIVVRAAAKKPSDGKVAVISGGEISGKILNTMVTNCLVEIRGEKSGSCAAAVASVLSAPDALVERCIAMNNTIRANNTLASAMVARVTAGTVKNCIAQKNEIFAGVRFSAGIVALVCGPHAVVDHCLSAGNQIVSGAFHAAGVAGEINAGVVVNCISDANVITVQERRCAGGVASLIKKEGNLVNCLSQQCTLIVKRVPEPYVGLVFGQADDGLTGIIANCVALSGEVIVSPSARGYIGVIGGGLTDKSCCADCYYHEDLVTKLNTTQSGRFYGCGQASGSTNYDCMFPLQKSILTASGSQYTLGKLNAGAYRLSRFGASEWIHGAGGLPTLK